MKDILVILGSIGGTWYLVKRLISLVTRCVGFYYKWRDYKAAYYEKHNGSEEKQIGFKQREKILGEKPLEKIKLKETDEISWFEEYWESEPVDDEFIEEEQEEDEEYEDELDKYPLLKTRK